MLTAFSLCVQPTYDQVPARVLRVFEGTLRSSSEAPVRPMASPATDFNRAGHARNA
jgi:hypothetical protein